MKTVVVRGDNDCFVLICYFHCRGQFSFVTAIFINDKIYVAKLGVRLICECGLYDGFTVIIIMIIIMIMIMVIMIRSVIIIVNNNKVVSISLSYVGIITELTNWITKREVVTTLIMTSLQANSSTGNEHTPID